jgi:hypothetical protein
MVMQLLVVAVNSILFMYNALRAIADRLRALQHEHLCVCTDFFIAKQQALWSSSVPAGCSIIFAAAVL